MATKTTSLVALFDDIVASSNILAAGSEGSKFFLLSCMTRSKLISRDKKCRVKDYISDAVCVQIRSTTSLLSSLLSWLLSCHCMTCVTLSLYKYHTHTHTHTVFAQFVSSQMGVNSQLQEIATESANLKVYTHCCCCVVCHLYCNYLSNLY